ncbi:hypothetical protein BJX63DRAFT_427266 [Aspergillus granulosus]|uniref:Uncharacterized protein n=1 Tax=Aspergillus granulosus TaxID=176169 RepID=A0ABR4I2D1_9EURO
MSSSIPLDALTTPRRTHASAAFARACHRCCYNGELLSYGWTALIIHSKLSVQWTLHRVLLHADFKTATYEVCTDGYLESIEESEEDKKIRVLVEVKAVMRDKKRSQESYARDCGVAEESTENEELGDYHLQRTAQTSWNVFWENLPNTPPCPTIQHIYQYTLIVIKNLSPGHRRPSEHTR